MKKRNTRLLLSMLIGGSLLSATLLPVLPLQAAEAPATSQVSKPLTIIDLSELQIDNAAALVLTFSQPLDDKQDIAQKVRLTDDKQGRVDGGWELSANRKTLRFRHPEPSRHFTVTVDAGLRAASGETLAADYSQKIATRDIQPMVGFASRGSLLPLRITQGLPV
ncbi:MAG TPA: hypothetical protein DHV34_02175, partial [Escherichia coli]|nr:hypothetical protein [Escherichia coli]